MGSFMCLAAVFSLLVSGQSRPAAAESRPAETEKRLLMISVDGLRGDWSAHPDRNGLTLPTISGLAARGVKAEAVRGVFPTVTYPSHTTLITGCVPARHGILSNEVFEAPTAKATGRWYWDYAAIQRPTLLDAAKSAGWSTAAVSWPVTVGAPADVNFPEVWEPGRYDDHFVEIGRHCKPPELIAGVLTRYDLGKGLDRDVNIANVARYIVDQYKPRMMLVHLVELDSAEHEFGPDSPEARAAAERCDARVAEILGRYEANGLLKNTVIAIVSDHGFLPVRRRFQINALLREKGVIRRGAEEHGPASDYDAVGWVAGGSCAIVLKSPGDQATVAKVREILQPYTGKADSPIRRILERDEIQALGSNPQAALMLDAGDGWTFGTNPTGPIETDSTAGNHPLRGMHGQLPDRPRLESTFVVAGPGIATKESLPEIHLVDIAPTLASVLGLPLKETDGHVVKGVQGDAR